MIPDGGTNIQDKLRAMERTNTGSGQYVKLNCIPIL